MVQAHLETELEQLRKSLLDMSWLSLSQLSKAKSAFLNMDIDIAEEVVHKEKRMNAFTLSIDRDCENLLALFNPVTTDLRYVISVLKTNTEIERIGDHAEAIANYVINFDEPVNEKLLKITGFHEMYQLAIDMLHDVIQALEANDTTLARKVYKKDKSLNKFNRSSLDAISRYLEENHDSYKQALMLFSIIKKLERVGDRIKNIAEDIIFYIEAKVYKKKAKMKGK